MSKYEQLFGIKPSFVLTWLSAKGQGGKTLTDGFISYLQTMGGSGSTLGESMNNVLTSLGYTGTFWDKRSSFYIAQTGILHPKDAELAFYNNSSLDFSNGGSVNNGVTFNGQQVTFNGQNVTFTHS